MEAAEPDPERTDELRLEALLTEHRGASAREIEEHVYTSIKDFADGAAQTDDLTMVIVKMTTEAADEDAIETPDSPRMAKGGPPAARGASESGALWGPTTANGSTGSVN